VIESIYDADNLRAITQACVINASHMSLGFGRKADAAKPLGREPAKTGYAGSSAYLGPGES
jgi:hypothetical protein